MCEVREVLDNSDFNYMFTFFFVPLYKMKSEINNVFFICVAGCDGRLCEPSERQTLQAGGGLGGAQLVRIIISRRLRAAAAGVLAAHTHFQVNCEALSPRMFPPGTRHECPRTLLYQIFRSRDSEFPP